MRSARRHKIGKAHILKAMQNAGQPTVHDGEADALHYVGIDDRGVELHVIAVPDDRHPEGLAVIHAMPTSFTTNNTESDADTEKGES